MEFKFSNSTRSKTIIKIGDNYFSVIENFKHLGSSLQKDGGVGIDGLHRIQIE